MRWTVQYLASHYDSLVFGTLRAVATSGFGAYMLTKTVLKNRGYENVSILEMSEDDDPLAEEGLDVALTE